MSPPPNFHGRNRDSPQYGNMFSSLSQHLCRYYRFKMTGNTIQSIADTLVESIYANSICRNCQGILKSYPLSVLIAIPKFNMYAVLMMSTYYCAALAS